MFIEIESLKPEPLEVRHSYEIGELNFRHVDAFLDEPVRTSFTLTHSGRDLRIGGSVETVIRFRCARCLKEFVRKLSNTFDLNYLPHPDSTAPDEEIELRYEDMDVGFYDGVRFDVDLMILEQIELSIPMKMVCREDCRGLCQQCGKDLNTGPCGCREERADPRMAVLKEFRKKMDS